MSSKLFDFESIDTHINLNLGIIADPKPEVAFGSRNFFFSISYWKIGKGK